MSSAEILDSREREVEKMEAKKHIAYLAEIDVIIKQIEAAKKSLSAREFISFTENIFVQNKILLSKAYDVGAFAQGNLLGKGFWSHDLKVTASSVEGFLFLFSMNPSIDDENGVNNLLSDWSRYKIAAEDILLRILDKEKVPEEFQTGIDVDSLSSALSYFNNHELPKLFAHQNSEKSDEHGVYDGVENRKLILPSAQDWKEIEQKLAGIKIEGNTAVVGNFVLNELRNSLKKMVDANRVSLSVQVDSDSLVIILSDDGIGMRPDQLSERGKDFIFKQGVSGTKSTGFGVSGFPKRLYSMQGGMRVQSMNADSHELAVYQKSPKGLKFNAVPEFPEEHGTVFEIRLPITKKAD